ncbi:MAG: hypothetical protein H7222_00435 [Methylotenera sp.]|nr:hypothetical protein [Oligoflexia bacterium]
MKNQIALSRMVAGSLVSMAQISSSTFAADHPCKEVKAACEAGGFVDKAHKTTGKGLHIDCMQKLFKGEPVAGVRVSPETVNACMAKKESSQAAKKTS